jgi:MerR family transcriptional regulator, mercuric resistance operon regulatory protein
MTHTIAETPACTSREETAQRRQRKVAPYTIAALARAAGVHVETVRYYQRRGLIDEPTRPLGGFRRYCEVDAERLRFIKRAQAMGFTLAEIANLLRLRAHRSCKATRELAATKLQLVDVRIQEMRQLRKELKGLIAQCDANPDETACPVIDRLAVRPRQVR